ncbi:long neurotoxin OH-57-like [Poecilia reticulata]|uniref:long neurotoxin OH-57-like n=1 Tax=Poecilia reticulata TaxID=8081 RepID=UPI0004A35050|nr:PREDICTED: long neurotoxin OH-57-like [Poecilia reticulata]
MGKFVLAVVAAVASLVLVESLSCNKCSFSLLGNCLNAVNETCPSTSNVCYTGRATFPSLPDFVGFNIQGCRENATGCDATTPDTMLGVTYNTKITCCSTESCNPITLSAAPSNKMALSAAVGAAVLASTLGSIL